MLRRGTVMVVAALLLSACPAAANPPVTAPGAGAAAVGPVLAGNQAVWTAGIRPPATRGFALRTMNWSGATSTLIDEPESYIGTDDPSFGRADLAGSSTRVAARWYTSGYFSSSGRSMVSAPGGFRPFGGACVDASHDVWREVLAHSCDGSVSVTDLNSGETTRYDAKARDVHIAGKYLAWVEPVSQPYKPEIVVFDREAAKEVYRVDIKALLPPAHFPFVRFDLREDGTVVAVYNNFGTMGTLAWFSPAEPRAHVIAASVGGGPAVAGDLIALSRRVGFKQAELAVIDFAGNTVQVFDRDDSGYAPGDLDFDGARLVWEHQSRGVRMSRFPVETDFDIQQRYANALSIKPSRFRVPRRRAQTARRAGATIRFSLSKRARVRVIFERRAHGVLRQGRCQRSTKGGRGRPCVRYGRATQVPLGRRAGAVAFRFRGRVGHRALKPGSYRAVVETRVGSRTTRELATPFRVLR